MAPKTDDDYYREEFLRLCPKANENLSVRSYQSMSRNNACKKLLITWINSASDTMIPFLTKTLKKMPQAKACLEQEAGRKRAAADAENERAAKKAKLESTKAFAQQALGFKHDVQGPKIDDQADVEEPAAVASLAETVEKPLAIESIDQAVDFSTAETAQSDQREDQAVQAAEYSPGKTEQSIRVNQIQQNLAEDASLILEGLAAVHKPCFAAIGGTESSQDKDVLETEQPIEVSKVGEKPSKEPSLSLASLSAHEIEDGLYRGLPMIHQLFLADFAKRPNQWSKDGSQILEVCMKLHPRTLKADLLKFIQTSVEAAQPISRTWDMTDGPKIVAYLSEIDRKEKEPSTHKVYGSMMLYVLVDAKVAQGHAINSSGYLNELTGHTPGAMTTATKRLSDKLHDDYNKGGKWFETAKLFGSTGIALIFAAVGIAAYKVTKWNKFERKCLELVLPYLSGVKAFVECLGDSALEDYCQPGGLPDKVIKKLEDLEVSGLEDTVENVEEEDEGDEEADEEEDSEKAGDDDAEGHNEAQ